MPKVTDKPTVYTQLRNKAEAHLEAGTTPASISWSMGVEALELLHRLSSNPESAGDALKLLHELQVHQVELDLQNEEIARNEQLRADELRLYRGLYESAPLGYLTIDKQHLVVRCNPSAEKQLGSGRGSLAGRPVDITLTPDSRPILRNLLLGAVTGMPCGSCVAEVRTDMTGSRRLQFLACGSPEDEYIYLACCELPAAG